MTELRLLAWQDGRKVMEDYRSRIIALTFHSRGVIPMRMADDLPLGPVPDLIIRYAVLDGIQTRLILFLAQLAAGDGNGRIFQEMEKERRRW